MEEGKPGLRNGDKFKSKEEAYAYWEKYEKQKWRKRMQPFCVSIPSVILHEIEFKQWCSRPYHTRTGAGGN